MARPINTRILLRNDTLANWNSSQLVLGKGEVAIATLADGKLAEVRVGTGTSKWAEALKLNVNADQISGLVETIRGTSKKYQVVANGSNGNSWKLQEAALSGKDWSDVAESTWTVDFTAINNQITALISDVGYLSGQIDAKLAKDDFANLSVEIGLDAATANNHVATQADIAALDGVMHFKGVVNAVPTSPEGYEVGDVVLVTGSSVEGDNGKEFVLVNTGTADQPIFKWELIGDQNAISALTKYVDTEIKDLSDAVIADYATKSDLTASANGLSTDYNTKFENLANTYATKAEVNAASSYLSDAITAITGTYATKDYVNGISTALSTDYVGKIKAVDDKFDNYALSADVDSRIAAAKSEVIGTTEDSSTANTVYGAKKYADETSAYALEQATGYADALSTALSNTVSTDYICHGKVVDTDLSGFFILNCGGASLRDDEPKAPSFA